MKFYKMISGSNIVGVVTQLDFVRFQAKHRIIEYCDLSIAQFVQYKELLYRDNWMYPLNGNESCSYSIVEIIEINEEEYSLLLSAFESNEVVEAEEDNQSEQYEEVQEQASNIDNQSLEFVRNSKLLEISHACNKTITDGFNIVLSDGAQHHFSLTTQDQLNLITLSTMIANGETTIPYHADGELCRFYSATDMLAIITYATQYKTYQVSYHNALKLYVESLSDMNVISSIYYGIEIPEAYLSDVLKSFAAQGNE